MKTKYFIFAASALVALASCSNDGFVGEENSQVLGAQENDGSIQFTYSMPNATRADIYGAAAADLLGKEFIVAGVKGDGTAVSQSKVFASYTVDWDDNTAGTTESNTADWEYVGKTNYFGSTMGQVDVQTIKYWDYSTDAYDFAAYAVGKKNSLTAKTVAEISTDPAPGSDVVYATPIDYDNAGTSAYKLRGGRDELTKCYITDMTTVPRAQYKNEVQLKFRSLSAKVRVALYETIPGYSVKKVEFYQDGSTLRSADISSNTSATLFGTDAFYTGGTYTVTFPHIGNGNSSSSDYKKAHVAITGSTATSKQQFGALNYTTAEGAEVSGDYLQRTSSNPSFAGTGTWYQNVLPNENGVTLTLRLNYTLVATDGSGEQITVYGAQAQIPATYTKWMPNYAYTYIFKLSDNTNGWTSPTVDVEGLYPITFDAVVLDSEETGKQTTITNVATPSITTYQKGHVYDASNEYKAGDIFVQAVETGTLKTDLNSKSTIYSLDRAATEAEVMDALNIRESTTPSVITGRNTLVLTSGTLTYPTTIPGEDGNDITVTANSTAKLVASAATYYAYVYKINTTPATPSDFNTAVELTAAPGDWNTSDNVYYENFECTTKANYTFTAGTYYKKYTNLNDTYAVKVIKVQ